MHWYEHVLRVVCLVLKTVLDVDVEASMSEKVGLSRTGKSMRRSHVWKSEREGRMLPVAQDGLMETIRLQLKDTVTHTPTFLNHAVSPSEVSQNHLQPAAIRPTPTLHFDWQRAFCLLKSTITLSSSTCYFHGLTLT